jgi:hypothetical protein
MAMLRPPLNSELTATIKAAEHKTNINMALNTFTSGAKCE